MPVPTADLPYFLGAASAEHARLIRQAAIWDPFTERLFREAGIGPGQRVLDIGSGVGDVAMLAAKLVGPSGVVVGVERDRKTIAMARSRVTEAGLSNVSFVESDVRNIPSREPFDAAVGRAILQYLPEAGDGLRSLAAFVQPGGVVAFQDVWPASLFHLTAHLPASVKMRFAHLSDLRAFRRAYGHGAGSLPRVPGSGPSRSEHPHRGSGRRRSQRRTMVLRSRLLCGVAPRQERTRRQRNWRPRDARIEA